VKLPIFFFHVWLPKAHVEAPVGGSIILAGVLLKLGGYGIYRFSFLLKYWIILYREILLGFRIVGGLVIRLLCLRQIDLKMLIAYSSVSHISLVIGGLISIYIWGINGILAMMIAHGFCSSGLFCLRNIIYERFFSRRLIYLGGMGYLRIGLIFLMFFFMYYKYGGSFVYRIF